MVCIRFCHSFSVILFYNLCKTMFRQDRRKQYSPPGVPLPVSEAGKTSESNFRLVFVIHVWGKRQYTWRQRSAGLGSNVSTLGAKCQGVWDKKKAVPEVANFRKDSPSHVAKIYAYFFAISGSMNGAESIPLSGKERSWKTIADAPSTEPCRP